MISTEITEKTEISVKTDKHLHLSQLNIMSRQMEKTSTYLKILEDTILFVSKDSSIQCEVINTQLNETHKVQPIRLALPQLAIQNDVFNKTHQEL